MPEDWQRAVVVVAHPDDIEYGAAAVVAKWTAAGRDVRYVLATSGEAGIAGLAPAESGPLREEEERRSAAVVGVSSVEFLGFADGRLQAGLELRRALAAAYRRHRPELVLTMNHRETWNPGSPVKFLNSADHRALGICAIDAAGDAANEWIFPELAEEGFAPWTGIRWVAVHSPPLATHAVDVSDTLEKAVASLVEHRRYLEALSAEPVQEQARKLIEMTTAAREDFGGVRAVGFELFQFG